MPHNIITLAEQIFVPKGWGHERWVINTSDYCLKHMFVDAGKRCSWHYHKNKDETFTVLSGQLKIYLSDCVERAENNAMVHGFKHIEQCITPVILEVGQAIRIKPRTVHFFTSEHGCSFVEVSTHHEDSDSYRIIYGD